MIKEISLPDYLSYRNEWRQVERRVCVLTPNLLALSKIKNSLVQVWTRAVELSSYDDNRYISSTSKNVNNPVFFVTSLYFIFSNRELINSANSYLYACIC